METLGDRIKALRRDKKLTQKDLAKLVGVTHVTVSQWESGINQPKGGNLQSLSLAIGVSPGQLLYGQDANKKNLKAEAEWAGAIEDWDDGTPLGEDEVEIPFFKEVQLAAGGGVCEVRQHYGRKLRFSRATLRSCNVQPEHAACVTVSGNSMMDILPDGATVGVDTSHSTIKDGKMYAIDHDGMLRVKYLYRMPSGGIRIRSHNIDEYPDEFYTSAESASIKIIGRVFWYSVLLF